MSQKKINGKRGRKNKYDTHVFPRLEEIGHWCREGLTEEEICKRLGVSVASFNNYKKEYIELLESLKVNKSIADYRVEDALYMKAIGYEYEEETIERIDFLRPTLIDGEWVDHEMRVVKRMKKKQQPDTTAMVFWLKNRRPDLWRDKHEIEHGGEITNNVDLSGLSVEELRKLARSDD
jgi:transcriptional regulator with XRE-family HTH domain